MPIDILMPALSPTMTEGTVARWLKQEGDIVKAGEVLAEIETDKATMEVEAVDEGVLGRIFVNAGTEHVAVNAVIAVLLAEGEGAEALSRQASPSASAAPAPATAGAAPVAPQPENAARNGAAGGQGRIFASPLARRIAALEGIDLRKLTGSGPNGRIVKADLATAARAPQPQTSAQPSQEATPASPKPATPAPASPKPANLAGLPDYTVEPHSSMRRTIARRLTESVQTVPHFYVSADIRLDALLKIREELNARAEGQYKLSVNDFIVRASALALARMPEVNRAWTEDGMLRFKAVDISVAVAIPDGLITPIVKSADKKGLQAISGEIRALATRAKEGKLKPEEYQGGTFSVSNLGMFGVSQFAAIINPPQACILAVGAGQQRPVVVQGAVVVESVMTATLSCDHRVVDGALGAQWLGVFARLIEDPLTMML